MRLSEFISLLEQKTGCRARLNFLSPQAGDVPLTIADTRHAEQVLGFHARVPIDAGLDQLVDWARANGVTTATARCYAGEGRLAYAPIAAWLKGGALRFVGWSRKTPRPGTPGRGLG